MKQDCPRGQWAGCTDLTTKIEELRAAHEQFEASELKKRLDAGYKVKEARTERPRIQKAPKKVVIKVFNGKITISYRDYIRKCQGFTIITNIY